MSRYARQWGILIALVTLPACDHPTPTQVRDAVEKSQQNLFLMGMGTRNEPMLGAWIKSALDFTDDFPRDTISVERDGRIEQFTVTVMERVYLPPPRSGAAPYSRRTLYALDQTTQRAFVLTSDDSISTLAVPSPELLSPNQPAHFWGGFGFGTLFDPVTRAAWFATTGDVELRHGPTTGRCKLKQLAGAYFEQRADDVSDCENARYRVSAIATFRPTDRATRSAVDLLSSAASTLRIGAQDVPGIRIVTRCPDDATAGAKAFSCAEHMNFWRSQSQFAPSIGIDVRRVETSIVPGVFFQRRIAGSGPALECCVQFNGAIRYTVFAPNGTILRQVDSVAPTRDSLFKSLMLGSILRQGGRLLLILPSRRVDRTAGDYSIVIADVTVLSPL